MHAVDIQFFLSPYGWRKKAGNVCGAHERLSPREREREREMPRPAVVATLISDH